MPESNYLNGSLIRHVLGTTALGGTSLSLFFATDLFLVWLVWQTGEKKTVAVLSIASIIWLLQRVVLTSLQSGFAVSYSETVTGQGANNSKSLVQTSLFLATMLGLLVGLITMVSIELTLEDPDQVSLHNLLFLSALRLPFVGISLICTAVLRCENRNITAFVVNFIDSAALCGASFLLLELFSFGVTSIGTSMVISSALSCYCSIYPLRLSGLNRLRAHASIHEAKTVLVKSFAFFSAAAIQPLVKAALYLTLIQYGDVVISTVYTCEKILTLIYAPTHSFPFSLSPLIGQNIQAKRYNRVLCIIVYALLVSAASTFAVLMLLIFFFPVVARNFGLDTVHDYELSYSFFVYSAASVPFQGLFFCLLISLFYMNRDFIAMSLLLLWALLNAVWMFPVFMSRTPDLIIFSYFMSYPIACCVGCIFVTKIMMRSISE